jgi:hypothetical protein
LIDAAPGEQSTFGIGDAAFRRADAAIEKRRCQAAVHRAPRIEVKSCWIECDDNALAFGLTDEHL